MKTVMTETRLEVGRKVVTATGMVAEIVEVKGDGRQMPLQVTLLWSGALDKPIVYEGVQCDALEKFGPQPETPEYPGDWWVVWVRWEGVNGPYWKARAAYPTEAQAYWQALPITIAKRVLPYGQKPEED